MGLADSIVAMRLLGEDMYPVPLSPYVWDEGGPDAGSAWQEHGRPHAASGQGY